MVLESPKVNGGTGSYWWDAGVIWPNGPYLSGEALYSYEGPWTTVGLEGADMTFELSITTEANEGSLSTYTDRISMPDPDNFKYLVYYAWLNSSDLDINWSESGLELVMLADSNEAEIGAVQDAGVKVYYYIALGRSYNDSENKDKWYANIKAEKDSHN